MMIMENVSSHIMIAFYRQRQMLKLFSGTDSCFCCDGIPRDNLILNSSDRAAYMRGKSSGIESKLRDKPPHLLDIVKSLSKYVEISM